MKTLRVILIGLLLLGGAGWVVRDFYVQTCLPYKGYVGEQDFRVEKGASVHRVAEALQERRIISSAFYFRIYYRLFGRGRTLQSGNYHFSVPVSMRQVLDILHLGRVTLFKLTVPEGLTVLEMDRLMRQELHYREGAFRRAAGNADRIAGLDPQATDLEGYLFPDTYLVQPDIGAPALVALMVDHFLANFGNNLIWRARDVGFSPRQAVTLASLIEKETAAREERFLISSVFHNRLRQGMLLDCDPTIVYALERDGRYDGKLGWDELKYPSPYNTRLNRGLPPGPICSPGLASIEAALYPESSNYLYFVAKDGHSHYFSESLAEHNQAVRRFIINRHEP